MEDTDNNTDNFGLTTTAQIVSNWTLLVLKFIGFVLGSITFVFYIVVFTKNKVCSKDSKFVTLDTVMLWCLFSFNFFKMFVMTADSVMIVSYFDDLLNQYGNEFVWTVLGCSIAFSTLFLLGLWMFSFRYLLTSCELHNLYRAADERAFKRHRYYENGFILGIIVCLLVGPLQFNDFDKL